MQTTIAETTEICYHCGENCSQSISVEEKNFCCEGCRQVFLLLNENDLCNYYDLDKNPGIKVKGRFVSGRFDYLDDASIINKLTRFKDRRQTHVVFSLPQMHCASCIWLLENLHKIHPGIISSKANFQRKEVFIIFEDAKTTLKKIVQLLAFTGYEPYISLQDEEAKKPVSYNRKYIYRIGVAGFCFGNIMMLSFPEYFSSGIIEQKGLKEVFSYLNLALSLPVIFFSATEFFVSAWKGFRQKWLNIDAPIALAILVAFGRSIYEITSGTGPGYLDSMSGIVFFMLIGRWFQNKTYDSFSFDRDYKSYFPLGVTVIVNGTEKNIPVSNLEKGNRILIRNEEMVPADAVLMSPEGNIDYSFVSGENTPVLKRKGELIYAGGKQSGGAIELEVVTPASGSYITQLWNNEIFHNRKNQDKSFIHPWSRYFTYALFTIALLSGIFWSLTDPTRVWPVITSVLIVACPCSLLLSATFTYGNMLRIFGKNKMYLKNAGVIETLGKINTLVFDKTGTITHNQSAIVKYEGETLNASELNIIKSVSRQSSHPLSKIITIELQSLNSAPFLQVAGFREMAGQGVEASVSDITVRLGSSNFTSFKNEKNKILTDNGTHIYVSLNGELKGKYSVSNEYREGISDVAAELEADAYKLHLLSGDNDQERKNLERILGKEIPMFFRQSPQEKMDYIKSLQEQGKKVLMLGDGLNDAGALQQSDAGIAVSDDTNLFSPACDAILHGSKIGLFCRLLRFARSGKPIVTLSFILSILYNIVGLGFATKGLLSPLVAAILMPASSISIVIFVTL
ncbi:MAG: heavy metal translocating P-type ATPase, partial [Chitinophagaceae bacterium]